MKKLEAYKQAKADLIFATDVVSNLSEEIKEIGTLTVTSSTFIKADSSDKQIIYAVGVLNAQLQACKELGIDSTEIESTKSKVIQLKKLIADHTAWLNYCCDLRHYADSVHKLLDENDLFALLEVPVRP